MISTGSQRKLTADTVGESNVQTVDLTDSVTEEVVANAFAHLEYTTTLKAPRGSIRRDPSEIRAGTGAIDSRLLDHAIETVESIDPTDPQAFSVRLASLSGLVCELWRTAKSSGQFHRQILTAVDNAVVCALRSESVTQHQLSAIREAIVDLRSPILTQANVDSIASHMIDEGYHPLAMVSDLSAEPSTDE